MNGLVQLGIGVLLLFAGVRCWVRYTGRHRVAVSILFLLLSIPFLLAGVFYTASSYSGQVSAPTTAPVSSDASPAVTSATPPPLAQEAPTPSAGLSHDAAVREAQKAAVARYPELGVADSPFNRTFVSAYRQLRQNKPEFFRDPNWPITLAVEVAQEESGPR